MTVVLAVVTTVQFICGFILNLCLILYPPTEVNLKIGIKKTLTVMAATLTLSFFAGTTNANEAADEIITVLKACKASKKVMTDAEAMIKKHKGKPTDDNVDDFIDTLDDKLIDCVDSKLD